MKKEIDTETTRKKLQFFYARELDVHITKFNNWFHNGKIVKIESDFLILNDEKEGEMPIFFTEIFEIEKREKLNSFGGGE